jgi:hypothetical protein
VELVSLRVDVVEPVPILAVNEEEEVGKGVGCLGDPGQRVEFGARPDRRPGVDFGGRLERASCREGRHELSGQP